MKEMSVTEFERALRAGLGRCIVFLDGCKDKEPYRQAVLRACLNDYAYDSQSEGTRAWYTYRLMSCFNDDQFFFVRVKHKLGLVTCRVGNAWEFEHLFDLVLQFARHGHSGAKQYIREIYESLLDCLTYKTPEPEEIDYELQWFEHICIEGTQAGAFDALIPIAADLGALFQRNEKYTAANFDQYVFLIEDWFSKNIFSALGGVLDPNGDIDSFLMSVEQNATKNVWHDNSAKPAREKKRDRSEENQPCDVNKILRDIELYDNTDPEGDWHSVAMDISYDEETVFPTEAYKYVYTGLCACCRNRVVSAMCKHGLLSDELLRECEYDSYEETRDLAAGIVRRNLTDKALHKTVHVIIDRPLGSVHPEHDDIIYQVNYGYVKDHTGGDGEPQDAYVLGVDEPLDEFDGKVIAVIHRKNDVEDKWVVAPDGVVLTDDEIKRKTEFMEKYFDIRIIG